MYNSETDCVEVSLNAKIHVSFNCQKCNTSVRLDEPSDIAYLTRLAREELGLYAKLASRDGGLQWYIEAMGEFNRELPHRFSLRIINYNLLTFDNLNTIDFELPFHILQLTLDIFYY